MKISYEGNKHLTNNLILILNRIEFSLLLFKGRNVTEAIIPLLTMIYLAIYGISQHEKSESRRQKEGKESNELYRGKKTSANWKT